MATQVIFNNGVTYAAGKNDLLVPELSYLFNQNYTSAEFPESVISDMGYVVDNPFNPNQTYSFVYGAIEMDDVTEAELTPLLTTGKGKEKGFTVREYANKIKVTQLMRDRLNNYNPISGADSSVKTEVKKFGNNYAALRRAGIKKKNQIATKVWTDGLNSAGTLTFNGQYLFSTAHPFLRGLTTASTFRNVLGGSYGTQDDALDATALQYAIDLHKSGLVLNNGDRVARPASGYTLVVGYGLEKTAQSVLNVDANNSNSVYAGTGNNANLMNTFNFKNQKINLLAHPVLGQYDKTGTQIGTDAYWFLVNTEMARQANALRHIVLNPGQSSTWVDEDSGNMYVKFYESYAFDHYGLESYIVGSKGTA